MQLVRSPSSPASISSGSDSHVGFVTVLKSAWTSARRNVLARRKLKAAVAELGALDDAMLADMGISRGEITTAVLGKR